MADNPLSGGQLPEPTQTPDTAQIQPQQPTPAGVQAAPSMQQQPAQQQVQPQAQPQQPAQPTPQQKNLIHDTMIGRAFKALSGQTTNYSVDPATGKEVQTQVQNTPGQFFKNIVASAILGGAIGAQNGSSAEAGSGLAAGFKGAQGVQDQNKQLDQERIQRAQQEYQNQQTAAKEQREAQAFQTEETLKKAQAAYWNLQQVKGALEIQNADYQSHHQMAEDGLQQTAGYRAAGINPDVTMNEKDHQAFMDANPGAATKYLWYNTGVEQSVGPDGKPQWHSTWEGYDKDKQIPVSNALLDSWSDLRKLRPDLFKVLDQEQADGKPKVLSPQEYMSISAAAKTAKDTAQAQKTEDLKTQLVQAQIQEAKSLAAEHSASLGKAAYELSREKLVDDATTAFLNGGNRDAKGNLTPLTTKQVSAIYPLINGQVKELEDAHISLLNQASKPDIDESTKKDLLSQAHDVGLQWSAANAQLQKLTNMPKVNDGTPVSPTATGPQVTVTLANGSPRQIGRFSESQPRC
jgi:hypothetical protein